MKAKLKKGIVVLSLMGVTYSAGMLIDNPEWRPSIFRTIATAETVVEFDAIKAENAGTEFTKFKTLLKEALEKRTAFIEKAANEDTNLDALIKMRDEEYNKLSGDLRTAGERSKDFETFFSLEMVGTSIENASEVAVNDENIEGFTSMKEEFAGLSEDLKLTEVGPVSAVLSDLTTRIDSEKEKALVSNSSIIEELRESLCLQKDALSDIKEKISKLLKDKEEVVAQVEDEEEADETDDSETTVEVPTYAELFAHIEAQQRSFFEMSTPSMLLPPTGESSNMFYMMYMMNMMRNQGSRVQQNSYYLGGYGSGIGLGESQTFPGIHEFGGWPTTENSFLRSPVTKPGQFRGFDFSSNRTPAGLDNLTRTIPRYGRSEGQSGSFSFL